MSEDLLGKIGNAAEAIIDAAFNNKSFVAVPVFFEGLGMFLDNMSAHGTQSLLSLALHNAPFALAEGAIWAGYISFMKRMNNDDDFAMASATLVAAGMSMTVMGYKVLNTEHTVPKKCQCKTETSAVYNVFDNGADIARLPANTISYATAKAQFNPA